jgi:Putative Ig domain
VVTTGGPLPPGLTLTTGGVLILTPTSVGTSTFLIQATDSNAAAQGLATKAFALTVNPPSSPVTITNATPLPPAAYLTPYSQTMNGAGGMPPYTWSIASGQLPPGLTLTTAGVLSGSATSAGTWNFAIQASDSSSQGTPGTKGFSLTVNAPPLGVPQPFLAPSTVGVAYMRTLEAIGGVPPYNWSIVSGTPPPGVTMTTAGVLSGTPTAAAMYTFTAKVSDNAMAQSTLTLPVQAYINPVLDFGTTSPLPPVSRESLTPSSFPEPAARRRFPGSSPWARFLRGWRSARPGRFRAHPRPSGIIILLSKPPMAWGSSSAARSPLRSTRA